MFLPTRTERTPANPSRWSPSRTTSPCGSFTTGLSATTTSTEKITRRIIPVDLDPADAPRGLDVTLRGPLDDIFGKRGPGIGLVPAQLLDVIAHELLVKRDGGLPFLPLGHLPESRGVGREDLVDERQLPVDEAELEFRVREVDADALASRGCEIEETQRRRLELIRELGPTSGLSSWREMLTS